MNVVKILTPDGKEIATYQDAYALFHQNYLFVFRLSVGSDTRKFGYSDGNWIGCFTGPVISWEEPEEAL